MRAAVWVFAVLLGQRRVLIVDRDKKTEAEMRGVSEGQRAGNGRFKGEA